MELISTVILFLLSAGAFFISFRSFQEKGFLFNNAWLYASEQERRAMDKAPHYRQSAIVFLLCGILSFLLALHLLLHTGWILALAIAVLVLMVLYAIGSGIAIEHKKGV